MQTNPLPHGARFHDDDSACEPYDDYNVPTESSFSGTESSIDVCPEMKDHVKHLTALLEQPRKKKVKGS